MTRSEIKEWISNRYGKIARLEAATEASEFLGRCMTCLDNAYSTLPPCPLGWGNGRPLFDHECAIRHHAALKARSKREE